MNQSTSLARRLAASLFVLALLTVVLVATAFATDTPPTRPSMMTNNNNSVINPEYAYDDEGQPPTPTYAVWDANGDQVTYTGFDLNIPAGATIDQVTVTLRGYTGSPDPRQLRVSVTANGDNPPVIMSAWVDTTFTTTENSYSFTGPGTLWGLTWTADSFQGHNFRVKIKSESPAGIAYLRNLSVIVSYHNAATATSLLSSSNPSTYGSEVTFTAAVTPTAATGTVEFYDGTTLLVTRTLSSGTATFSTGALTAATHSITAKYLGDGTYGTSTSSAISQLVSPRALTVTADAQTKVFGTPDPALTYQITAGALVTGDALSGALTRAPGEDVGSYLIQQWTLTAGSNYTLTFVGANLTITKASQTITVTTHAPASALKGASFTVAATGGGSGNPVTYSASGACTNVGATFTMTSSSGICTVRYDQAGNTNYLAAAQVTETVNAVPSAVYLPLVLR